VIVGYGPVGQTTWRVLSGFNVQTAVIDLNLDTVRELAGAGKIAIYGGRHQARHSRCRQNFSSEVSAGHYPGRLGPDTHRSHSLASGFQMLNRFNRPNRAPPPGTNSHLVDTIGRQPRRRLS
jgi:hypothetical protein